MVNLGKKARPFSQPDGIRAARSCRRLSCTLGSMKEFALPIGWLVGVIAVVTMGFASDPYLEHVRQLPSPHPYPVETVLWIFLFMSAHVGMGLAILRPKSYRHSWGRALVALLTSTGFFVFAALGAMHAPPAHITYIWWLL